MYRRATVSFKDLFEEKQLQINVASNLKVGDQELTVAGLNNAVLTSRSQIAPVSLCIYYGLIADVGCPTSCDTYRRLKLDGVCEER